MIYVYLNSDARMHVAIRISLRQRFRDFISLKISKSIHFNTKQGKEKLWHTACNILTSSYKLYSYILPTPSSAEGLLPPYNYSDMICVLHLATELSYSYRFLELNYSKIWWKYGPDDSYFPDMWFTRFTWKCHISRGLLSPSLTTIYTI